MFSRWLRKKAVTIAVVLIIMTAFLWLYSRTKPVDDVGVNRALAVQFMNSRHLDNTLFPETVKYGGTIWQVGFTSNNASLLLEPKTGQIAILNKETGRIWSGSPTASELSEDATKGTWSSNLQSPFIFSYVKKDQVNEMLSSPVGEEAVVSWERMDQGFGVSYMMDELGFQFYVEYALTPDGFSVHIPEHGILESKENKLTNYEILPFFGAVLKGKSDGYLFVPDGPGGLITFNKDTIKNIQPYSYPIYGDDRAALTHSSNSMRTNILYPVFGMKRGNDGFIGIMEDGQFHATITASPAGVTTGFYRVNVKIPLRRLYERPSSMSNWVQTYENDMLAESVKIQYVLLDEGQADYVTMAHAYRNYLISNTGVAPLAHHQEEPPLFLEALMSAAEPTMMGDRLIVATTFKQLEDMAIKLKEAGVKNLKIGITGWNKGGYPGKLPVRFPMESAIGGNEGFIAARDKLKQEGIQLYLNDDYQKAFAKGGGFSSSRDGVYDISGRQFQGKLASDWYAEGSDFNLINPRIMNARYFRQALETYDKLNIEGIALGGVADFVFSDFHPKNHMTRKETAQEFIKMMDQAERTIGYTMVGPDAFAIGHADHLTNFPLMGNGDFLVDTTVPFYAIALHGLLTYSSVPSNQRANPTTDFLKGIEYGALPSFIVSHIDSSAMTRTIFSNFYQTRFDNMEKQISKEYDAIHQALGDVWDKAITGHREVAEGVYETAYETGKSVWTNYNDVAVNYEGVKIAPMSFAVTTEGRQR
ncbi:DUF5696 domain-containing protein [Paenibacillus sp.]|uniref:DUF5696 domain-containing protein n=1 Tax=Paenibacillus sp. TaxID=58172 RepID=UPI002810A69F|nr:DUF5696 domain-containing protein [Paenibacillus sp.]